ncbi:MAG: hypothetical protein HZA50_11780 [Planctomycetes bacterium]|nr:hypothetical protein [Planctomycetota bacterium]
MNGDKWYRCNTIRKIRGQSVPCGFVGRGEEWSWRLTCAATRESPEEWAVSCPRCHNDAEDCADELCEICMRKIEVCRADKGHCVVSDIDGEPLAGGDHLLAAVLTDMADDNELLLEAGELMVKAAEGGK